MKASDTFIDEVTFTAIAGDGGDGCATFRREKFVPRGGPNGGDGGRGGDVVLVADRNLATLFDRRIEREVRAARGGPGETSNRTGRDGESVEIGVPVGTLVLDEADEQSVLADLSEHGRRFVAARSGRGGRGNARFATATRQTPDRAERGGSGQHRKLRLSLKLLADVGLVGLPNAGKSTLLRRVSAARPRVADYPFTTLVPSLGVAEVNHRRFVVADIPGLVEGASRGVGLGDRFLRHIERTRVVVHLLDVGAWMVEARGLLADYEVIRRELAAYDSRLAERAEIVALNKIDLLGARTGLDAVEAELRRRDRPVVRISGATGEGVEELLREIARALDETSARVDDGVARKATSR